MMTEQERIDAFRTALTDAGRAFGVQVAIVSRLGNVILDQPTLAFVLIERAPEGVPDDDRRASTD